MKQEVRELGVCARFRYSDLNQAARRRTLRVR